ncbi:MAG: dicarboxylate/amino acid:cation symporter [Bacteroidetes bacterium]|nr:dicarboxylate/amino acid:cation symporter [Bacteroidota bacterium]
MKNHALLRIFIALFLAVAAGLWTGTTMGIFGVTFFQIYSLIGQLFLNALTLVVVPLVASSIIIGAARMGAEGSLGGLGLKTIGYFFLINLLAITLGLCVALIIQPGIFQGSSQSLDLSQTLNIQNIEALGSVSGFEKFEQILFKLIPSNILAVASQGQMLGLVTFCLFFGYFIPKIEPQLGTIILGFWKGIFQIMMAITEKVMVVLPIGVFGLVAKVVASTGVEAIRPVLFFTFTIVSGLLVLGLIILPLLLKYIAGVNPLSHFRAMAPALLTAFSTSSSAASLPITLDCVEKRAKVSNRVASFSLPLGISLNLSASAFYVIVTVLFIAQVYGYPLTASNIFIIFLMTFLTSIGVAAIPSACLVSVVLILNTLGLPGDAVGLILPVERILDMCRTVINVFSNSCSAVLVAKSEGEKNLLVSNAQV